MRLGKRVVEIERHCRMTSRRWERLGWCHVAQVPFCGVGIGKARMRRGEFGVEGKGAPIVLDRPIQALGCPPVPVIATLQTGSARLRWPVSPCRIEESQYARTT